MSLSVETLAVARKYTDDSLAGAGAVAGVPCKIQSITAITGGNRVTFLWTDNNGDDHTSAMDVMNGVDGEDGKGIQSVSVNAQNHLIITYIDGTTVDAGQIEIHSSVDSVNGQTGAVVLDAEDVGALPDNTPIPSKTSDLTNDSGFATTSDVSTALADYTKTADLTTLLAAKQDTLTFDNAPTENSNNPVKSGGVYAANQTLTNQVSDISDEIADMNNVLGAKNLLPYPYAETTKTVSGVTFTDNGDGTITLNGTHTDSNTTFMFHARLEDKTIRLFTKLKKMNTSFKLLGGVSSPLLYLSIDFYDSSGSYMYSITNRSDMPTEFTIPSSAESVNIFIRCAINAVYSNLTIYPMLYLASIEDDTYAPYAKTNRELTEKTASIESDISAINAQLSQLDFDGAGAHNSIYRGKYLGAEVTAEQYTAISDGTFKDMYIGDYWTIGGVNYRIGAFDYWYNTGDINCTTHHVLLVPDTNLANGKMNDTNITTGGYAGSDLKTGNNSNTALATAKSTINNAFGSTHILTHREYFTNAVADGKPSEGAWYDSDIDLMNENMVYGTNIFLPHPDGSTVPNLYTIDKTQIKLFTERPDLITNRANWWLRDVVSAANFADVNSNGFVASGSASFSLGMRPAFAIKG